MWFILGVFWIESKDTVIYAFLTHTFKIKCGLAEDMALSFVSHVHNFLGTLSTVFSLQKLKT